MAMKVGDTVALVATVVSDHGSMLLLDIEGVQGVHMVLRTDVERA